MPPNNGAPLQYTHCSRTRVPITVQEWGILFKPNASTYFAPSVFTLNKNGPPTYSRKIDGYVQPRREKRKETRHSSAPSQGKGFEFNCAYGYVGRPTSERYVGEASASADFRRQTQASSFLRRQLAPLSMILRSTNPFPRYVSIRLLHGCCTTGAERVREIRCCCSPHRNFRNRNWRQLFRRWSALVQRNDEGGTERGWSPGCDKRTDRWAGVVDKLSS